jgi:hypothetical protein
MSEEPERHSRALEPSLVSDPDEIARIEARNGVRQFDAVTEMIEGAGPVSPPRIAPQPVAPVFVTFEGWASYCQDQEIFLLTPQTGFPTTNCAP